MSYTENFGDFGIRERRMITEIMNDWNRNGLPDDFSDNNVRPAMNMNSGFVFLVNDDCQVAMMNGDRLESFYSTPYEGREGFFDDLLNEYSDMHRDDQEYMRDIARALGREDEIPQETEA